MCMEALSVSSPVGRGRNLVLLLLLIPFVGLLAPGWYSHGDPKIAGIPFFVWYQFLWVLLGVCITGAVYILMRDPGDR